MLWREKMTYSIRYYCCIMNDHKLSSLKTTHFLSSCFSGSGVWDGLAGSSALGPLESCNPRVLQHWAVPWKLGRGNVLSQAHVVAGRTWFLVSCWLMAILSSLPHGPSPTGQINSSKPTREGLCYGERSDSLIQYSLIMKVTSHHLCRILLVKSKSQSQPMLKTMDYGMVWMLGVRAHWESS